MKIVRNTTRTIEYNTFANCWMNGQILETGNDNRFMINALVNRYCIIIYGDLYCFHNRFHRAIEGTRIRVITQLVIDMNMVTYATGYIRTIDWWGCCWIHFWILFNKSGFIRKSNRYCWNTKNWNKKQRHNIFSHKFYHQPCSFGCWTIHNRVNEKRSQQAKMYSYADINNRQIISTKSQRSVKPLKTLWVKWVFSHSQYSHYPLIIRIYREYRKGASLLFERMLHFNVVKYSGESILIQHNRKIH